VTLAKRVDGVMTALAAPQDFNLFVPGQEGMSPVIERHWLSFNRKSRVCSAPCKVRSKRPAL